MPPLDPNSKSMPERGCASKPAASASNGEPIVICRS